MHITIERPPRARDVRVLRGVLLSLGGICILGSLVIAVFHLAGPDARYTNIVVMGFGFGIPLLVLGLLAPKARRHRLLRVLQMLGVAGGASLIGGYTLIALGGDQRPPLGGIAFVAVLIGMLTLPVVFLASLLATTVVDTVDRHEQRKDGRPAVPSRKP